MTWQDGGDKWWLNESTPGRSNFRESNIIAGQGRANALIDLNRDRNVDWLHERPGVAFEFGDGKGNFKPGGHLEVAPTRNEINMHSADFNGDGFIDLAVHWGRYDYERGKSAASVDDGLCFGDLDGDGALDIIGYTGSLDGQRLVKVYRNELPAQNWLRVRLTGAGGNRSAAGAKIRLTERSQPEKLLWFEQVTILDSQSAHSYYSLAPTERHFGLGRHGEVDVRVEFYPSGKIVKREVKANSTILISETE